MAEHQNDATELQKTIRSSRRTLFLSRHWIVFALVFLFLYTGLSLVAPVFMEVGLEGPADILYKFYSPMCHQFAFRSWFFFGDQVAYPRAEAGSSLMSFEEAVQASGDDHFGDIDLHTWSADLQLRARSFNGNEQMGYKTALCERDVAIYGAMFLAGLLYIKARHWLRPAPVWLYLILGLGPIGLDGVSQLFSYPPVELWPVRETLPIFRLLTGALFGVMNVWLAFPYIERSTRDAIDKLETRLEDAEQRLTALQAGEGE